MKANAQARRVRRKYRPSVRTVLIGVAIAVLALVLTSFAFLRFYDNQLVRETEAELISQAAVLSAVFQRAVLRDIPDSQNYGAKLEVATAPLAGERYLPVSPRLDIFGADILPPRPAAQPAALPPAEAALKIGRELHEIFAASQVTTLAGLRVLDERGAVIGGRDETGSSLAHVDEVRQALEGRYASVLRQRISHHPPPDFFSLSRGGGVRLFVAFPVVHDDRLRGVIYLSRTPDDVLRQLYATRYRLGSTAAVILSLTLLLAIMASARILRPVRALAEQARELAKGDWSAMTPLKHYGTRELAVLGEAFLDMAHALQARSTYIKTFATHVSHEFKTPLTSIRGSAELLLVHIGAMKEEDRTRFREHFGGYGATEGVGEPPSGLGARRKPHPPRRRHGITRRRKSAWRKRMASMVRWRSRRKEPSRCVSRFRKRSSRSSPRTSSTMPPSMAPRASILNAP